MRTIHYWESIFNRDDTFITASLKRILNLESLDDFMNSLLDGRMSFEKMQGYPFYRARLNYADRLLVLPITHEGQNSIILLEVIEGHQYHRSTFLTQNPSYLQAYLAREMSLETSRETPTIESVYTSHARYMQQRFITFNSTQQEAIDTPAPALLTGPGGSGKTYVLAERFRRASLESTQSKPLYITQSSRLVHHVRELISLTPDRILSYQDFAEQHLPELSEFTIYTLPSFKKWFQQSHYHIAVPMDTLYQELRLISAFKLNVQGLNEASYVALGERQSNVSLELRAILWRLYDDYLGHLTQQKAWDPAFQPLNIEAPCYDIILIDESMDFSALQLIQLYQSAIDHQCIFALDQRQSLYDTLPHTQILPFLLGLYTQSSLTLPIIQLTEHYRCPYGVLSFINTLITIKETLHQGTLEKTGTHMLTLSPQDEDEHDTIHIIKQPLKKAFETYQDYFKSTKCAFITHKSLIPTLQTLCNSPNIFSIEAIKGLEFDTIFMIAPFEDDQKVWKSIHRDFGQWRKEHPETLCKAHTHRPKKAGLTDYTLAFNTLITGLLRAKKEVYWIEPNAQSYHQLYQYFLTIPSLQSKNQPKVGTLQASSAEDWAKHAALLKQEGFEQQAQQALKLSQEPMPQTHSFFKPKKKSSPHHARRTIKPSSLPTEQNKSQNHPILSNSFIDGSQEAFKHELSWKKKIEDRELLSISEWQQYLTHERFINYLKETRHALFKKETYLEFILSHEHQRPHFVQAILNFPKDQSLAHYHQHLLHETILNEENLYLTHLAAMYNLTELIPYFKKHNVSIETPNRYGKKPLLIARLSNFKEFENMLIKTYKINLRSYLYFQSPIDLNRQFMITPIQLVSYDGVTETSQYEAPLDFLHAIEQNNQILVQEKFNINQFHIDFLKAAAQYGHTELCLFFIKNANGFVNFNDYEGDRTPITYALYFGNIHLAITMLELGLPAIGSCLHSHSFILYTDTELVRTYYTSFLARWLSKSVLYQHVCTFRHDFLNAPTIRTLRTYHQLLSDPHALMIHVHMHTILAMILAEVSLIPILYPILLKDEKIFKAIFYVIENFLDEDLHLFYLLSLHPQFFNDITRQQLGASHINRLNAHGVSFLKRFYLEKRWSNMILLCRYPHLECDDLYTHLVQQRELTTFMSLLVELKAQHDEPELVQILIEKLQTLECEELFNQDPPFTSFSSQTNL